LFIQQTHSLASPFAQKQAANMEPAVYIDDLMNVERRRCHLRLCCLAINTPCAAGREHVRAILWIHHLNAAGMKIT